MSLRKETEDVYGELKSGFMPLLKLGLCGFLLLFMFSGVLGIFGYAAAQHRAWPHHGLTQRDRPQIANNGVTPHPGVFQNRHPRFTNFSPGFNAGLLP